MTEAVVSSQSPPAAAPPASRPGFGPWHDPSLRRRAAAISIWVVLYILVVDALWSIVGMVALSPVADVPSDGWLESYDSATAFLTWAYTAVFVVAGVFFVRWQRLAIRNTAFLGCEQPEPSPNLATVAWFIPFVSLVVPFISIRRVSQWSRPDHGPDRTGLLAIWWAGWVLANLGFSVVAFLHILADDTTAWIAAAGADASLTLLFVVDGVLALKVVNSVTRDQVAKAGRAPGA